jgi:hypothetical protein
LSAIELHGELTDFLFEEGVLSLQLLNLQFEHLEFIGLFVVLLKPAVVRGGTKAMGLRELDGLIRGGRVVFDLVVSFLENCTHEILANYLITVLYFYHGEIKLALVFGMDLWGETMMIKEGVMLFGELGVNQLTRKCCCSCFWDCKRQ